MPKFRVENAVHKKGWTRWISPKHGKGDDNYKAKCCDCGLVHEMQFRIVPSPKRSGQLDVIFRMRREK